ncbi:MAG: hypothetical protein AABX19_03945 [Nanoarchaeota archaeon]
MNFIKKIFENKVDDTVHRQFKRFSKGNFENRALVDIKVGSNVKVKTSFEYANDFARFMANTIKDKVKISGGVITTKDIKKDLDFEPTVKQFAGVKTYLIENEMSKDQIINLMDKFPDALFLFSLTTEYGTLKTKVKAPKAGKAGKGDEEPKADYCVFSTSDKNFVKEFAFDIKEPFKSLFIKHTFVVESLVVPEEYKNDLEKARMNARRKGKIIRNLTIDEKQEVKEMNFEA